MPIIRRPKSLDTVNSVSDYSSSDEEDNHAPLFEIKSEAKTYDDKLHNSLSSWYGPGTSKPKSEHSDYDAVIHNSFMKLYGPAPLVLDIPRPKKKASKQDSSKSSTDDLALEGAASCHSFMGSLFRRRTNKKQD
jgi:hypothetical protein